MLYKLVWPVPRQLVMIGTYHSGHIKLKILAGFILSLAAVVVAGVIAFRSLDELQATSIELSEPDHKQIKFQEILVELNRADIAVRAYSLSHDDSLLRPYFSALYSVERKLDTLREFPGTTSADQARIDTISALVSEKIEIYRQLIELRKQGSLTSISADLLKKIERDLSTRMEYREEVVPRVVLKEKEGSSIFGKLKRLLGSDEEQEFVSEQDTVVVAVPVQRSSLSANEVKEMLDREKRREAELLSQRNQQELALLEADMLLMNQVRDLLFRMQKADIHQDITTAILARERARGAVNLIMFIIILLVVCMVIFLFMVFNDISKSNRYRRELDKARSQAERLAHLKEQLLANMSHEIRTPLNAILGFSEQLAQTDLQAEQKRYLDAMRRSSDLLLHTVNDILHFSKLEAGKLKIEEIPFKMEDLITDVISTLNDSAERKGIKLEYKMDNHFRQIMMGDPFRLKQILLNLLSNAIKFTDRGSARVEVAIDREEPERLFARFEVSDTGIGISTDKLESIFEEFSQADTSVTRKFGGTGLGLTIVKKLVELQGGSISVDSSEGKGTTFTIVIPFRKARKGVTVSQEPPVEIRTEVMEGKKVLLVDDDEMNQMLGTTILRKWQLDIDQAFNGREALEKISGKQYDVVLMDIQMPEMSGIDVTRQVRSKLKPPLSETPILAVTANVIKSDIEKYMDAGMDDYLLKPYNEKELYRKISQFVQHNGGKHADRLQDSYDLKDLYTLAGNDPVFMHKFLKTFIKEAESGNNRMMELLKEKRYEDLSAVAHRLIPSMVHVGADDVVPVLRQIEKIRKGETSSDDAPGLVVEAVDKINHILQLIYTEEEQVRKKLPGDEE